MVDLGGVVNLTLYSLARYKMRIVLDSLLWGGRDD